MTVAPGTAFLISLIVSSETSVYAIERWPVIVELKDVRGAVSGAAIAVPRRARRVVSTSVRVVGAASLTICHGLVTVARTPRPSSSMSEGARW